VLSSLHMHGRASTALQAAWSSPAAAAPPPAGYDPSRLFTTDPAATPVRVVQWGFCGDTWPFFRPNFVNLEAARQEAGAQEVRGGRRGCRGC
jgi:hypothetical protein